MKKEIDIKELKQIQLDILQNVHEFCIANHINYSLASGTLIGAVRHKGYIPWDDDIDICLLRDEYKKLEKAFPNLLNGKYRFMTIDRDEKWYMPWGKIIDTRTVMTEETKYKDHNLGVFIDVFPMDDVPDNDICFSKWNKIRKFLLYCWFLKNTKCDKKWTIMRNIRVCIVHIVTFPFSMRKLAKYIDTYIQKTNGKSYTRVYESCDSLRAKHNQSKEDFSKYIDVEFEGATFKAMTGYDDYLMNIYGEYMKLPPIEKRVTHHSFNASWK